MAKIGLNNFRVAVATIASDGTITYDGAQKPSKAVSFSFEPTVSDAKLYADDGLAESDSRVTGGTVTLGLASEDLPIQCDILGHEYDEETGEVVDDANDIAPYVGVGRVTRLLVNGVQKFRATVLALCKFTEPSDEDNTMGESVEFNTYELSGTMVVPENGKWRHRKVFTTQAAAIEYIESILAAPSI